MVKRMVGMLQSGACKPWQLVAWTFTRNAAQEMRERLEKHLGPHIASQMQVRGLERHRLVQTHTNSVPFRLPTTRSPDQHVPLLRPQNLQKAHKGAGL